MIGVFQVVSIEVFRHHRGVATFPVGADSGVRNLRRWQAAESNIYGYSGIKN